MKNDLASVMAELRREQIDFNDRLSAGKLTKEELDKVAVVGFRFAFLHGLPSGKSVRNVRMEKQDGVDGIVPKLVSLAKIQPDDYRGFCLAVHERVDRVHNPKGNQIKELCDEAMLEAERRLRHAQDALLKLTWVQRWGIGHYTEGGWELTDIMPAVLKSMAMYTRSGPYSPSEPKKRGPKKERRLVPLREFVRDLWQIVRDHGGGFSLYPDDRGGSKGTLVDALRLLERVLPPGFVPKVISTTTFNKLRPDRNFRK
jgi:hypothetical protein